MDTVFHADDYCEYLFLMAEWCNRCNVRVWAYCLMSNHVHLNVVPGSADGLCRAISEAHRRYTRYVSFAQGWKGYLWQGRFASFPMDEHHLIAAARYVEMNPVTAGIVSRPDEYRYSSAAAHLSGENDILVKVEPLLQRVPDWKSFLYEAEDEEEIESFRLHERTGRPLGDDGFVTNLEALTGRILKPRKSGRKRKK